MLTQATGLVEASLTTPPPAPLTPRQLTDAELDAVNGGAFLVPIVIGAGIGMGIMFGVGYLVVLSHFPASVTSVEVADR